MIFASVTIDNNLNKPWKKTHISILYIAFITKNKSIIILLIIILLLISSQAGKFHSIVYSFITYLHCQADSSHSIIYSFITYLHCQAGSSHSIIYSFIIYFKLYQYFLFINLNMPILILIKLSHFPQCLLLPTINLKLV